MAYVENESFMHKFAKEKLASILSKIDSEHDFCEFNGLKWRSNYGVFTELKFYETSDPYYFECSEGLITYRGTDENLNDLRGKNPLDWFDKRFNRGRILFVPDITIFHKGVPLIFIEIVHTHSLGKKKMERMRDFFIGHSLEIYEVSAQMILSNTTDDFKRFDLLEYEFLK